MKDESQEKRIKLLDIVDLKFLQDFQDAVAKSVNVASIIVDDLGPITKPSNFTDFCINYTRSSQLGTKRCNECDIKWGELAAKKGEPVIYNCHAGLTNFAVPIMLNGQHLGSILGGQVLTNAPDEEHFRNVAREFVINEDEYIEALRKIKIIPFEQVKAAAQLLFVVANSISETARKNLELLKKSEREILHMKITETIRSSLDIDKTLSYICDELARVFKVQRATIIQYHNDGNYSHFEIKREYKSDKQIKGIIDNSSFNFEVGKIWAKSLEGMGNCLAIDNIQESDQPDFFKENYALIGQKSIIIAPIEKDDLKWGVVILSEYNYNRHWTPEDINLLKTISNQIYIAIQQSELYSKMKQQTEREKAVLSNLPFMVWLKDTEGVLLSANEPYAKMCNTTIENLMGKTDYDFFPKEHADLYIAEDNEVMKQRKTIHSEDLIVGPDGPRWHETYKTPMFDEKGEIVGTTGFSRDITERKEIDRMKNEFVSMVSHELRTPLTSIRGALGLVTSGKIETLSKKTTELLDIANNNCLRLINLINDILDIEKMEAGKMDFEISTVELIHLIEQSVQSNIQYAQKFNVELELTGTLEKVFVRVDSNRLIQVLTNLLSNAIKFSEFNSNVKISVTNSDTKIRVSITNYGSEISKEFETRIFQKFAQEDSSDARQKGGTGLGLSISKAIIEKMGGYINFISLDKETTFYFDLPKVTESKPTLAAKEDNANPKHSTTKGKINE